MNPEQFNRWLEAMKASGRGSSDTEVGKLLGKSRSAVARFKLTGSDRTVALACNALINGLEVYE